MPIRRIEIVRGAKKAQHIANDSPPYAAHKDTHYTWFAKAPAIQMLGLLILAPVVVVEVKCVDKIAE